MHALLADVPRKNSWPLANHIGHVTAHRFEHLVIARNGTPTPCATRSAPTCWRTWAGDDVVLIADDTAAIKKGDKSVGVADQYCGLTGQVENCQAMPTLAYASRSGHAFVNRRLYLPQAWSNDAARRARAGVPGHLVFRT